MTARSAHDRVHRELPRNHLPSAASAPLLAIPLAVLVRRPPLQLRHPLARRHRLSAGNHPIMSDTTAHQRGISRYAGRSTRRYKAQSAAFRAHCQSAQRNCWLCGKPIDYTLSREHPESFANDHALPVSTHPELAEDVSNFRPSHRSCNEARGNDDPHLEIGVPSERW